MNEKIRIKDIAERAGVSVGTVDRVLHNRSKVSKEALAKVQKALSEMNYQPNVYASALAYNRSYTFHCIIPKHSREEYWEEIELGIKKATEQQRDFRVEAQLMYYNRLDPDSFVKIHKECLQQKPDGVILVPPTLELTQPFADELHSAKIPFILLDSNMPEVQPLSFYGLDSVQSGKFAARMFMLLAHAEPAVMLMKQTINGRVLNRQQENREVGFRTYMKEHFQNTEIIDLNLPLRLNQKHHELILEKTFNEHPEIRHIITLNSKASIVGNYLHKTSRNDVQIMGYDMTNRNAECLRRGNISFIITQHAYQQGFLSIDTLFKAIVLKKKVRQANYMPIDLITKENIDFYHRTLL